MAARLQQVIDELAASLPTGEATVHAAVRWRSGGTWTGAAGADAGNPDRPIRMASVGKTFTAATVLRLVELGRLRLEDPIVSHLTPATTDVLRSDGYDLSSITVQHLLQHTAGLFDYAFGEGSPLLDRALNDRRHVWTRAEQIRLAVDVGAPLAEPEAEFHYSDTGYVLLGEIIEQVTGVAPYSVVMHDLLAATRPAVDRIWLESGDQAPDASAPIARSFFEAQELTDLDFSIDGFGGGGLAGTTADIAFFFDALVAGRVFDQAETLAAMQEVPPSNVGATEFGVPLGDGASGLFRLPAGDVVCWSHRGFLGTIVLACPEVGATVVVTTNVALTEPLPAATALLQAAIGE